MDKNTLKSLVKSYFKLVDAPATEESKEIFASATLADGTEISNDKDTDFAVGDDLFVKDSEGNWVQAPEGEHTSQSGITIVVDAEGKITGVHHPGEEGEGSLTEMAAEEEAVEATEEAFEAEDIAEDVVEEAIESGMTPEQVIETVKEVVDTVIAPQLEEMKSEMANCMARLAKYEERMAEEPATMSAQQRKFAALEKVKATKGEGKAFDPKAAQLEAVLSKIKKNK